jgi:hypothetical protein
MQVYRSKTGCQGVRLKEFEDAAFCRLLQGWGKTVKGVNALCEVGNKGDGARVKNPPWGVLLPIKELLFSSQCPRAEHVSTCKDWYTYQSTKHRRKKAQVN